MCCSTVSSILGAWLDQYSEDFWSPPNYDCLHQLLSYLHRHFPGSDLERRARNLLAHFHRRQQCEPDPDGMKAGQERHKQSGAGREGVPLKNECVFNVNVDLDRDISSLEAKSQRKDVENKTY